MTNDIHEQLRQLREANAEKTKILREMRDIARSLQEQQQPQPQPQPQRESGLLEILIGAAAVTFLFGFFFPSE